MACIGRKENLATTIKLCEEMNSGKNDMDQWLQQSAEMGNAAFREVDWQHMQQLLQPKKKRRFIVFWWLLALLIGAGVTAYLFLANDQKANQAKKEFTVESNDKLVEQRKNVNDNDSSAKISNRDKQQGDYGSSGKPISLTRENPMHSTNEKQGLEDRKIKLLNIQKQQKQITFRKPSIENKTQQRNTKAAIDVLTVQASFIPKHTSENASTNETEKHQQFKQGEFAKLELNLSIDAIKIVDSISKKDLPKDTPINKKKKQSNKNEWSFAAGYYTGNIPLDSKGINAKLEYSIKLGSCYVQPSLGASTFNTKEEQVHKQTIVKPPTGTTSTEVDTRTVYFTPVNGFTLHPSLAIGWQTKRIKLFTGVQQNIVLNGSNNTSRVQQDSAFYPVLPPGIVTTKAYDASLFNGSKSMSLKFGIKYNVGKRLFATIEYSSLLDYNTVEGIVDEKKKRTAISLLVGIRL
jgi:hypothetical protein